MEMTGWEIFFGVIGGLTVAVFMAIGLSNVLLKADEDRDDYILTELKKERDGKL